MMLNVLNAKIKSIVILTIPILICHISQVSAVSLVADTLINNESAQHVSEIKYPWDNYSNCELGRYSYKGLNPDAEVVISELKLSHRITQALNTENIRSNYHGVDTEINGVGVTSALEKAGVTGHIKDSILMALRRIKEGDYREIG